MTKSAIGLIGLAVMGENLALNIARNGHQISVFNRTQQRTRDFLSQHKEKKNLYGTYSLEEFVESLERPRKIILLVQAGSAVDKVIDQLVPLLDHDDIIIDSGNSFFKDSERRYAELKAKKIRFVGMGISGGEKGALLGPSMMPGGDQKTIDLLIPMFEKISAKAPEACVTYVGNRGSGHYVKMVHNGIEYADMQLISEIYSIAKYAFGMSKAELVELFEFFKKSELSSYLIDITCDILKKQDDQGEGLLVDKILDVAEGKGTGKWTVLESFDLGCPIPTITAAVEARNLSGFKELRQKLNVTKKIPEVNLSKEQKFQFLKDALLVGKILAYTQGMHLLKVASTQYQFDLNLSAIARIWKGGCIIRSSMLSAISEAYYSDVDLLIEDDYFAALISKSIDGFKYISKISIDAELYRPALSSALSYYDGIRSGQLSLNLVQAQRDYFGAHTYKRVDREGVFHTNW